MPSRPGSTPAVEGGDADARDAAWLRIRSRFERGVDWSGLERERVARWYRQLHIFLYPFYYIEYGIAQIGALQVWRNSLREPRQAVARYREALALGAVRPLPEMYRAAGARAHLRSPDHRRAGGAGGGARSSGSAPGFRPPRRLLPRLGPGKIARRTDRTQRGELGWRKRKGSRWKAS